MFATTPCAALKAGKCLKIAYDGFYRVVEVHAVGVTKDGNDVMRVWQTAGGSVSGETQGWKLLRLDEAIGIELTDQKSAAPRRGYNPEDKAMQVIHCRV